MDCLSRLQFYSHVTESLSGMNFVPELPTALHVPEMVKSTHLKGSATTLLPFSPSTHTQATSLEKSDPSSVPSALQGLSGFTDGFSMAWPAAKSEHFFPGTGPGFPVVHDQPSNGLAPVVSHIFLIFLAPPLPPPFLASEERTRPKTIKAARLSFILLMVG